MARKHYDKYLENLPTLTVGSKSMKISRELDAKLTDKTVSNVEFNSKDWKSVFPEAFSPSVLLIKITDNTSGESTIIRGGINFVEPLCKHFGVPNILSPQIDIS